MMGARGWLANILDCESSGLRVQVLDTAGQGVDTCMDSSVPAAHLCVHHTLRQSCTFRQDIVFRLNGQCRGLID